MDSTTPFLPLDLPADMAVMVDLTTLAAVLATVPDLRHRRGIRYPLVPLILIALLAKLSGATRLCALAEWAQLRAAPLARLFGLSRTTMPHYTTWSRIFGAALDPTTFAHAVQHALLPPTATGERPQRGEIVLAVDGKTVRGTIPLGATRGVHLVAAYLPATGVVLAQCAVDDKANEIVAVPTLLATIDLEGMVVVGDAMQAQRRLSTQIVEQGGDYLWTLKDNQPHLRADIVQLFTPLPNLPGTSTPPLDLRTARTVNGGHGRIEERILQASTELAGYSTWPYLAQVFQLERRVTDAHGHITSELRYGITSLSPTVASAQRLMELVRAEWGIENGLHYRRDVTLLEDAGQLRRGHGPEIMASLNNLVIGLAYRAGPPNLASVQRRMNWQLDVQLAHLRSC